MALRQALLRSSDPPLLELVDRAPSEPSETDAMLVLALREQDIAAAGRLYDRYATNVRGMVHRLLGPDTELDDVVQDVFLAAMSSIHKLRDPGALKSWLLGIAVGKARDNLRARWRRRWLSFLPNEELPDRAHPAHDYQLDLAQEVSGILDQLPTEERIALLLHRLEGMSLDEAAQAANMSVSTFKRRLARGEAKFISRAKRRPTLSPWMAEAAAPQRAARDRN